MLEGDIAMNQAIQEAALEQWGLEEEQRKQLEAEELAFQTMASDYLSKTMASFLGITPVAEATQTRTTGEEVGHAGSLGTSMSGGFGGGKG